MTIDARDRLILALDFPVDPRAPERPIEAEDAHRLVDDLGDRLRFVKVGWPLYMAGGNAVVRGLRERGKRVFLDLKFGDIPETVRRLITVAVREEIDFLTLNTSLQGVRAAAGSRGEAVLKLLTVTLLTSMSAADLEELGVQIPVEEYVVRRARGAREAGGDGVIASGREAAMIREAVGADFLIVTPGIRPEGRGADDHKRAVTPEVAIRNGADYLVVGRPILRATDPHAVLDATLEEMQRAFDRCR